MFSSSSVIAATNLLQVKDVVALTTQKVRMTTTVTKIAASKRKHSYCDAAPRWC